MSHNNFDKRKLKVLMLAPTIVVGGITTWLKFLLKYSNKGLVDYEIIDTSKLYEKFDTKFNLKSLLYGSKNALLRFYKLFNRILKGKPDIVYFTCAPSLGFAYRDSTYLLLAKILKISTVVHLHGGNVDGFFKGNFLRKLLVFNSLKTASIILVITREMESYANKFFGEKVKYMPNMFDDALFKNIVDNSNINTSNNSDLRILHVAWQSVEKGTIDLINAIPFLKSKVICYLVGTYSKEFKHYADKLISDLNLEGKVIFTGQKTGNELKELYTNADLFVFPTHRKGPEGFPMVILEAMAYGLPIIANEVGNIREMIGVDDEIQAGILLDNVDPISHIELAQKIDELANDQSKRNLFSSSGRQRICKYYLATKIVPELEHTLLTCK